MFEIIFIKFWCVALVILKHHRRLCNNMFDTDIFRCINTHIKGVYLDFFGFVYDPRNVCVKDNPNPPCH